MAVTRPCSAPVVLESMIASPRFNSENGMGGSRSNIWPISGPLGPSPETPPPRPTVDTPVPCCPRRVSMKFSASHQTFAVEGIGANGSIGSCDTGKFGML